MSAILSAMRVEITFSNGMKQMIQAESVTFVKDCAWEPCHKEFRTEYLQQIYHSNECAKAAANYRYKTQTK